MQIIGNGLIAKAFQDFNFTRNCVIFASGVSDSADENNLNFEREFNLLESTIKNFKNKRLVYFSTCSLNSGDNSKYKMHKKNLENYILKNCASYNIFRLPQVVGVVDNNTLISYFIRNLKYGNEILVQTNATRHLLDVEDIPRITNIIIEKGFSNRIIDIAPLYHIDIFSIVNFISKELNLEYKINLVNSGSKQNIFISNLENFLDYDDKIFSKDYWKLVLKKYSKKINKVV